MGFMGGKKLYEKMMEIHWERDRIMAVALVFEKDVLSMICIYSPQGRRSLEEEQCL